jgi:hypothetical protein
MGILVVTMLACIAPTATAQRGGIQVMTYVNFSSAYRLNTVVPIDIIVDNQKGDISGHLTLSLISNKQVQSPIYELPIESPKGSRKRFRVNARLGNQGSFKVMLYHQGRAALDYPIETPIQPIAGKNLLALIVDEEPGNFAFLFNAMEGGTEQRSIHRCEIKSADLALLPDHSESYDAYDVVIFGNVDISRIGQQQRDHLESYVKRGGVLAVTVGSNATQYRGSWFESLAGIQIGGVENIDEAKLAEAVFESNARKGARSNRPAVLATLTPVDDEVRALGNGLVLSTIRPHGAGRLVTIGIDAESRSLIGCDGYLALWREILAQRAPRDSLNYAQAAEYLTQRFPESANIQIYSRWAVFLFLGLYIGIGVVGNWIFCFAIGKRDWVWGIMVVCSLAFTFYALLFGTAGRVKEREFHEVAVLKLPEQSGLGVVHSFLGIVPARTEKFTLTAPHPNALIEEMRSSMVSFNNFQPGRSRKARPFRMQQGRETKVSDLIIGASEMRLFEISGDVTAGTGINGTLTLDDNGLSGTLVNDTGLPLGAAQLYYGGRLMPLNVRNDRINVALPLQDYRSHARLFDENQYQQFRYGYHGYTSVEDALLPALLSGDEEFIRGNPRRVDADAVKKLRGPFLFAWLRENAELNAVISEPVFTTRKRNLLLVADVDIENNLGSQQRFVELPVAIDFTGTSWGWTQGGVDKVYAPHSPIEGDVPPLVHTAKITLGDGALKRESPALVLRNQYDKRVVEAGFRVAVELLPPQNRDFPPLRLEQPEGAIPDDRSRIHANHTIESWREYVDENGVIRLAVYLRPIHSDEKVQAVKEREDENVVFMRNIYGTIESQLNDFSITAQLNLAAETRVEGGESLWQ